MRGPAGVPGGDDAIWFLKINGRVDTVINSALALLHVPGSLRTSKDKEDNVKMDGHCIEKEVGRV